MSRENVEIVRAAAEAYEHGEDFTTLFDAGIVWNPAEEEPMQGLEAVRAYMERWEGGWQELKTVPEQFVDAGDRVLVTVHFAGRGRDGIEVDARVYEVYTVSRGKIIRMDEFTERSDALEAVGLSE